VKGASLYGLAMALSASAMALPSVGDGSLVRPESPDFASRSTPHDSRPLGGIPQLSKVAWLKAGTGKTRRSKAERAQRRAARRQRGKR
jgi:hypothetical protein